MIKQLKEQNYSWKYNTEDRKQTKYFGFAVFDHMAFI